MRKEIPEEKIKTSEAYFITLLNNELKRVGISSIPEISAWQTKISTEYDNDGAVEKIVGEMKKKYPDLDKNRKIKRFLANRKAQIMEERDHQPVKPPEEVLMAVQEALNKGKYLVTIKSDSKFGYENIKNALRYICEEVNKKVVSPTKLKLPFMITKEKKLTGVVLSKLSELKKTLTLVKALDARRGFKYVFFGEQTKRGHRIIAQYFSDFYMYKFQSEGDMEYILLSPTQLKLDNCIIEGMQIVAHDYLKIGETAKIPSTMPVLFVHSQHPEIRTIDYEEFKVITKGWDYEKLAKMYFGIYRHPKWFEKFIMAWSFSSLRNYSGYPLHLAILSPPGLGKSFMLEGFGNIFKEEVAAGSSSTIMGLIPSHGKGKLREGYLARCKRFGFVDEFFATLKRSLRHFSDVDSGTYLMLELLDHLQRPSLSGYGKITVNPRMKALFVSNNNAYHDLETVVDATKNLLPAFMSRILWYEMLPAHQDFIQERKSKIERMDKHSSLPSYTPALIEVIDYFSKIGLDIGDKDLKPNLDRFEPFLPSDLIPIMYKPRAGHHLLCLIDGYAKLNSLLEKREKLEVTDKDIEEATETFGIIVTSWAGEVNLLDMPPKNRIPYLRRNQRNIFEFVKANPGLGTPEILTYHSNARQYLTELSGLNLLQSVTGMDGNTQMWYTFDKEIR